jgi:hypothetical protein
VATENPTLSLRDLLDAFADLTVIDVLRAEREQQGERVRAAAQRMEARMCNRIDSW